MKGSYIIDGCECDFVAASDRGLNYGDGLFETMAARDGGIEFLENHLDRLRHGAASLGLPLPAMDVIRDELFRLVPGQGRAVIKLLLSAGSNGRGYQRGGCIKSRRVVSRHEWPAYPATSATRGVAVRMCRTRLAINPALAGLKTLNRLEQVLARAEWDDPQVAEGLMMDPDGRLVCGTMSNLFLLLSGSLVTPDLARCGVAGVMRNNILQCAARMGIDTRELSMTIDDLFVADEVFLSNSLITIWPVYQIDGQTLGRGQLAQTLRSELMSGPGVVALAS